jgi:hypothetical protein
MSTPSLVGYLNDHLAGSVVALELLEHLIPHHQGTDLGAVLADLRREIAEDQDVLRRLIDELGGESLLKKAGAWVAEKVARLKIAPTGSDQLALLEALETLTLGILGKRALWRALAMVRSRSDAPLARLDLEHLERRAETQYAQAEAQRLQAARRVIAPDFAPDLA